MHSTNYSDTFISVSPDFVADKAGIPDQSKETIASIQYRLICSNPYALSSDDVIYETYRQRNKGKDILSRGDFFAKGQACFRASPLTKRYGWGIHLNSDSKVAIYAMESAEYKNFLSNSELQQIRAMRSKKS